MSPPVGVMQAKVSTVGAMEMARNSYNWMAVRIARTVSGWRVEAPRTEAGNNERVQLDIRMKFPDPHQGTGEIT